MHSSCVEPHQNPADPVISSLLVAYSLNTPAGNQRHPSQNSCEVKDSCKQSELERLLCNYV
jgi:hypothetical protein